MICPAGEADGIPGWTAEFLFSDSEGYIADKCICKTNKTNTAWGSELWYFIGYEKNKFVEVLRYVTNTTMQNLIDRN